MVNSYQEKKPMKIKRWERKKRVPVYSWYSLSRREKLRHFWDDILDGCAAFWNANWKWKLFVLFLVGLYLIGPFMKN
jgi:hypothetical protein